MSPSDAADRLKEVEFDALPIKPNSRERLVAGRARRGTAVPRRWTKSISSRVGWPGWPILTRRAVAIHGRRRSVPISRSARSSTPRRTSHPTPHPDRGRTSRSKCSSQSGRHTGSVPCNPSFSGLGWTLWTGATVTRLESRPAGDEGRTVTAAACRTASGRDVKVTARELYWRRVESRTPEFSSARMPASATSTIRSAATS